MSNQMSIENFVNTAKLLPSWVSILLRGETGVGKSQITHQLGKQFKLPVIDIRLSQMSEGDMIGLPSTDGECTRFNPPDWYKAACDRPHLLFLDELNRASPEVMQAAFQIVLDRKLGHKWDLHPDTRVYCAINMGSKFTVNEMDPALLRRFFVIDLEPTTADWIKWAQSTDPDFGGNINETIIDFIRGHDKWLDPVKNAEPNSVQPTRHSWERLDKSLKHANIQDNPGHPSFYHIVMGFIGIEPAIAFCDFAKSSNARITGEDVLNRYPEIRNKVKSKNMTVDKINAIMDRVVAVTIASGQLTDDQGNNLIMFGEDIDKELRLTLWTKLVAVGVNNIELAKSIHKFMHKQVLAIFDVPAGDKGVGVVPKIPASLQK